MTNRKQLESAAWKHTHKDFRSKLQGEKVIMVLRSGGSTLVGLTEATDAELLAKLPAVLREFMRTGRTFETGQRFDLTVGQEVIANGFPGVVTEVSARGSVSVKLASGYVFLSPTFPTCFPAK